jgi:hypothetical protein
MRPEQFQPTLDGEGRLLLLIAAFSAGSRVLEGRTKLAKLDFFLRYPAFLRRAMEIRRPGLGPDPGSVVQQDIEGAMVRYRYGPWDPSYFALLGRLMGKGLVQPVPFARGLGYRATEAGRAVAATLAEEPAWVETASRVALLNKHFDLSGTSLTKFVYDHFPEVTQASWEDPL